MSIFDDIPKPAPFANPFGANGKLNLPYHPPGAPSIFNSIIKGIKNDKTMDVNYQHPTANPSLMQQNSGGGQAPSGPAGNGISRSANQEAFNPNGTRQGADDIPESTYRGDQPPMSLHEYLLGKMQDKYVRPDASQYDFSPIDNALKGRLDLIEGLKTQARTNFDKSDLNIDNMHQAFQREVQTKGADNYNKIGDQQKTNLTNDTGNAVNAIQANQQKGSADREAMLQRLGIQAAGAAVDPSTTSNANAVTQLQTQGANNAAQADNNRASNLALNNSVAQSIGQDGVQRRGALAMQLQALEGRANLSEMDAKGQAAQQKASMLNDAQGVAYKAFQDQQNRYQNLFDTTTRDDTQNRRYDMQYGPGSKNQASGGGGYGGIADDLSARGVSSDDAAAGMAALDEVLKGGNYLAGITDTNVDRSAVLAQKIEAITHNKGVAAQIATNYGKISTLK